MNRYALTLKPVLAAIVLGACSTTPDMPKDAWKIAPVLTVRHSGPTAAGFYALGRVKEAQGATAQAIDAYRKALGADPSHTASWNAIGALHMQSGRIEEGLQALERAVSLSPATSHLHNNLAMPCCSPVVMTTRRRRCGARWKWMAATAARGAISRPRTGVWGRSTRQNLRKHVRVAAGRPRPPHPR